MPDYKAMYTKLFLSQSQAIHILQGAQQATEEMYVDAEPPSLSVFPTTETEADNKDGDAE